MITQDIRSKIKKIKIHTKRVMQSSLSGDYLSAFKGSGLEFDQLREYSAGDDVRFIDWNSSAKMNKIMVKQFIEERDRTIILAIDLSASTLYSSGQELRRDSIAQIAAAIAFIANHNKDKIGALFFSDHIEEWIAPSRGNVHVGKIIEKLFSISVTGPNTSPNKKLHRESGAQVNTRLTKQTNINEALKFLVNLKKRSAVVFMLSDWIDNQDEYSKLLRLASCKYDFIGVRLLDECERNFPDIGLLDVIDPETGQQFVLDSRKVKMLGKILTTRLIEQKALFDKYRIDLLDIALGKPFLTPLVHFFSQRIRR